MFKPAKAKTVKEYINSLAKERKELVVFLNKFIQKSVPKFKPYFSQYGIGYGKFMYKNYRKESAEWPVVGLVSQKHYVSIYVCAIHEGKYVAERYKKELGNVSVGRSCIRIKKLEDVHLPTLKKVLRKAEKHPGLVISQK